MESTALLGLVKQLDGNLTQLEDALGPMLEDSLNATSKKLPLLERAKLNVTVVYAIESLIFSYLKVNGNDPRDHPVFKEIERVKHYFNKVKEAEESSNTRPSITLNKQAAARIIQHSLASNGSPDLAQREREAKERFMLKRKLKAEAAATIEKPAPGASNSVPVPEVQAPTLSQAVQQDHEMNDQSSAEEGEIEDDGAPDLPTSIPDVNSFPKEQISRKRKQKQKQRSDTPSKLSSDRKAEKKARKKAKKEAKAVTNGGG